MLVRNTGEEEKLLHRRGTETAAEIITAWLLGRRDRPKKLASTYWSESDAVTARWLLLRAALRIAVQLLQILAGQLIFWIDLQGVLEMQSRLLQISRLS
jgi:hypothetical protein